MNDEHQALAARLGLAQEILDQSKLRPELHPPAFAVIFAAIDGSSTTSTVVAPASSKGRKGSTGELSERLTAVAEAFEVDRSVIEQVFADDADQLIIVVPSRRFESSSRGAMRQVAILTACARQAGGWDASWTQPGAIKAECERVGVYSKNFGAVLDSIDMFAAQGTGAQRQLRAHQASFDAATGVLKELGVLAAG